MLGLKKEGEEYALYRNGEPVKPHSSGGWIIEKVYDSVTLRLVVRLVVRDMVSVAELTSLLETWTETGGQDHYFEVTHVPLTQLDFFSKAVERDFSNIQQAIAKLKRQLTKVEGALK